MPVFNADYAIFGTITAKVKDRRDIGSSKIYYINEFGENLYGDMRGMTILQSLGMVANDIEKGKQQVAFLNETGSVITEGRIKNRYVKIHSRYIKQGRKSYVQCAIMDMTESTILQKMLYGTSEALKRAAEAADEDTGMHISRINHYSELLASLMNMPQKYINDISKYAQLHDIGKIKVTETIRLPRKLTVEEFASVKKHTVYGAAIVSDLDGLEMAHNIAIDHHEKWDGNGYPNGKKAEEISLEGRIVAIVDVFDALVSERSYKPAYSYDVTFDKMKNGDDRILPAHFDPQILQLFLHHYKKFVELHQKMKD